MGKKLLPPYLDGKLPAQVGGTLRIPYVLNRGVSTMEVTGFKLKIKTIFTGIDIGTFDGAVTGSIATFQNIDTNKLVVGQFYKAQLACVNYGTVGYFSTVGIFKYTDLPQLSISSNGTLLSETDRNSIQDELAGIYYNENDVNEKVYSYKFEVYEGEQLYLTSGTQIHSAANDAEANSSEDLFVLNKILDPQKSYSIVYSVVTSNGLEVHSPSYQIVQNNLASVSINASLETINNPEKGSIKIRLIFNKDDGVKDIQGKYRLFRYSSIDDFTTKEELTNFIINDTLSDEDDGVYELFEDMSVAHGISYIYGLVQHDDVLYSQELKTLQPTLSRFEDMFISDATCQLCVKFNPEIRSFKETILESKVDTIGGRYPFIFRNGNTRYKEFSISGLISHLADAEETFMNKTDLPLYWEQSSRDSSLFLGHAPTDLTFENIAAERVYKLRVLEWLNNGQPKIFRSPTEGNYIVRLMNVTLSPEKALGRMLHSFNCTAYEIAKFDYSNLKANGFIGQSIDRVNNFRIHSIKMNAPVNGGYYEYSFASSDFARIRNAVPDSKFSLVFEDGSIKEIYIGKTGQYNIDTSSSPLTKVYYVEKPEDMSQTIIDDPTLDIGTFYETVYPLSIVLNGERKIVKSVSEEWKCDQYIGTKDSQSQNILNNILSSGSNNSIQKLNNIFFLRIQSKSLLSGEAGDLVATPDIAEDPENYIARITYQNGVDTLDFTRYIVEKDEIQVIPELQLTSPWYRDEVRHVYVLDANDFSDGLPTSITVGAGLYVDIFYGVTTMTLEDIESPYKEEWKEAPTNNAIQ